MIFEQIRSGGCLSYVIGCEESPSACDARTEPWVRMPARWVALSIAGRNWSPEIPATPKI